jgi:hypothetical protein
MTYIKARDVQVGDTIAWEGRALNVCRNGEHIYNTLVEGIEESEGKDNEPRVEIKGFMSGPAGGVHSSCHFPFDWVVLLINRQETANAGAKAA